MNEIILLTDYKGRFGSKHFDIPYRSGMDKELIAKYFSKRGFRSSFINLLDINFRDPIYKDKYIVYTSSEDDGYLYKSYIEDIVYGLELAGAKVIPSYKYLRANNNKVFMEILRDILIDNDITLIDSRKFGTLEDLKNNLEKLKFPCVLKKAAGASGTGVFLAENGRDLIRIAKRISRTRNLGYESWDWGRSKKHPGYKKDSRHRNKFIVQEFIPGLKNDWKIYVFGSRLYIFNRPILKGRGITASGGGYDNYYYGRSADAPDGIFDFAQQVFNCLQIPHASLDIAFAGKQFYLTEFQALYFGTAGIPYSDGFYIKKSQKWEFVSKKLDIEEVYVDSVVEYLAK